MFQLTFNRSGLGSLHLPDTGDAVKDAADIKFMLQLAKPLQALNERIREIRAADRAAKAVKSVLSKQY